MVIMFLLLLLLDGAVGVLMFFAWRRVTEYLRSNPESARLFSECIVTPLLTGKIEKPEVKPETKKTKGGTLV